MSGQSERGQAWRGPVLGAAAAWLVLTAPGCLCIPVGPPVPDSGWWPDGSACRFVDVRPLTELSQHWVASPPDWGVYGYNHRPSISSDGLTIYSSSDLYETCGWGPDLWVATRPDADSPFGLARCMAEINLFDAGDAPSISGDDLTLCFDLGSAATEIWFSTRPDAVSFFGEPRSLVEVSAAVYRPGDPEISRDGLSLHFECATDPYHEREFEICVATRPDTASPFSEPAFVAGDVNTEASERNPAVTADGLTLYCLSDLCFLADEVGGVNCPHLWVATRESTSAEFRRKRILAEIERGDGIQWDPAISPDGTTLYFSYGLGLDDAGQTGIQFGWTIWQAKLLCR